MAAYHVLESRGRAAAMALWMAQHRKASRWQVEAGARQQAGTQVRRHDQLRYRRGKRASHDRAAHGFVGRQVKCDVQGADRYAECSE
jgi:hypothetical protein